MWKLPTVTMSFRISNPSDWRLYREVQAYIQGDTKKQEILKNPTKIEEIQEKKLLTEIEPLQLAF